MNAVQTIKQNLNPDVFVDIVMQDPNHKARVKARSERERKAYYNAVEQERNALRKQQAALEKQRKKEQRAFEFKLSRMATDFEATKATLCVGCLIIGYLLSFVCV